MCTRLAPIAFGSAEVEALVCPATRIVAAVNALACMLVITRPSSPGR
jgi:hypothetical protein